MTARPRTSATVTSGSIGMRGGFPAYELDFDTPKLVGLIIGDRRFKAGPVMFLHPMYRGTRQRRDAIKVLVGAWENGTDAIEYTKVWDQTTR